MMNMLRPQARYREMLFQQLLGEQPETVLDVGAGMGVLLARLAGQGIAASGLVGDPAMVNIAQDKGMAMTEGQAQNLPFTDNAFDWVVSEFSLHHFAEPERAVAEMVRVSRCGVIILDQWYDTSLKHQQVAKGFDEWFKGRDRAGGMVHNANFTTEDLHALAAAVAPGKRARIATILEAVPFPLEVMLEAAAPYRARGLVDAGAEAELATLASRAGTDGLTDDGALLFTLYK